MSVDTATVQRIARLARIAVKEDEVEHLKAEINDVLAFVEQLSQVDVSGVEPMTHALAGGDQPPLREYVVQPSLPPEDALANAPGREGTCFKVPRIIE